MDTERQSRQAQMGRKKGQGFWNAIDGMAASLEGWLHTDFGEHFLIERFFFAVVVMALWCYCCWKNDCNVLPMEIFGGGFVVLCVVGWMSAVARRCLGRAQPHTHYPGRPILMRILPLGELTIKRLEPFIVFGLGYATNHRNAPLGIYLMVAAVCLFICNTLAARRERLHTLQMHNSVVEQSVRAERFRDIHGS